MKAQSPIVTDLLWKYFANFEVWHTVFKQWFYYLCEIVCTSLCVKLVLWSTFLRRETHWNAIPPLQWRHNGHDGVSNHQPHDCLLTVYSGTHQRKHQSSASLAFVRGIHRGPVNSPHKGPVISPHKGPVTRKRSPFDHVIMTQSFIDVMCSFPETFVYVCFVLFVWFRWVRGRFGAALVCRNESLCIENSSDYRSTAIPLLPLSLIEITSSGWFEQQERRLLQIILDKKGSVTLSPNKTWLILISWPCIMSEINDLKVLHQYIMGWLFESIWKTL